MSSSDGPLSAEKYADLKAQLRVISDRVRRQIKELLARASCRPQSWRKPHG